MSNLRLHRLVRARDRDCEDLIKYVLVIALKAFLIWMSLMIEE